MAAKLVIFEPLNLFTGGQGAGKTLFAIEQADLLQQDRAEARIYQVNIRKPDVRYLPHLPFGIEEMLFDDAGNPVTDEQGNHLPKWTRLPIGSVVIVDEAHKVFPQRGPGRPPRWIEAMAESRYEGIRWLFLTQAPGSLDAFLRDRMNRHFHIERKGGMNQATFYEFENRVVGKDAMPMQKRHADAKHVRRYPKKYFTWYESAKQHYFRVRIPLKVWAALVFIPIALFVAYKVVAQVGGLMGSKGGESAAASSVLPASSSAAVTADRQLSRTSPMTPEEYVAQFAPVVPWMPWSAPVHQQAKVTTQADLYCMASGAGRDANGEHKGASCSCMTEQGTPYVLTPEQCLTYARNGIYNPFRAPPASSGGGASDKPEKPRHWASGVDRAASSSAVVIGSAGSVGGVESALSPL